MIVEERREHAVPKLDLLDHYVHAMATVGGWTAICFECPGRQGWRGSLYLHMKEESYEGGASFFNAQTEAWQHDMTVHARLFREWTWDELISGKNVVESTAEPLIERVRWIDQTLDDFIEALKDYFRALVGR